MENTYNEDVQRVLIGFMLSDREAYSQTQNIIDPQYFDSKLRPVVRFIQEYSNRYRTLPLADQVLASTGVRVDTYPIEAISDQTGWFLETVEAFCRYKALEGAVLDGVDLIQKGQYGELERRVKEAVTISLMRDLGTSYADDPLGRLTRMRDKSNYVSTGIKLLDDKLHGGFTPGALNVFAGGSGSGKSLICQNIALNWALAGLNVIYFSLELSEELVALRLDAMTTGMSTTDVMRRMDEAALKIKMVLRGKGELVLKKLPEAGTTANDLRAFCKEWEIKTGKKIDAIVVDYLDLMFPCDKRIDISNAFQKDKYTSEEMRALAGERNLLCVTASQLNRTSVQESEFDHSHIAGGISKINTADNVFGILATPQMRENGKYQLQFLKTRSSSAVGQKIDLAYDPATMRITDPSGGDAAAGAKGGPNLSGGRGSASDIKADIATKKEEPVRAGRDVNSLIASIMKTRDSIQR